MLSRNSSVVLFAVLSLLVAQHASNCFEAEPRLKFAGEIVRALGPKNGDRNFIVSPASAQTVLALTAMGAKGPALEELHQTVHLEYASKVACAKDYQDFLRSAILGSHGQMSIANRIYLDKRFILKPLFNNIIDKYFDSSVETIDFGSAQKAANEINQWVDTKTHHKISNLVDSASLNSDTAAVLVNALHFKANWTTPFEKYATNVQDFYVTPTQTVRAQMMHQTLSVVVYESAPLDMVGIELPFEQSDVSLLIMLPNKKDGLRELESKINLESLTQLTDIAQRRDVEVYLPKFKIAHAIDFKAVLKEMGVHTLFTNADFGDMLDGNLYQTQVSNILQKATIDVNEAGVEAAAATYVGISDRSMFIRRFEPPKFKVDHPFVFILKSTKSIFFIGHVVNPLL